MTKVFISYSRMDIAFVEQLVSDLKETGLDVWYDLSGLDGGVRWRIEIEKAIRESQYVLVVLSPDLGRFRMGGTGVSILKYTREENYPLVL